MTSGLAREYDLRKTYRWTHALAQDEPGGQDMLLLIGFLSGEEETRCPWISA
jgi:hypothetical protein